MAHAALPDGRLVPVEVDLSPLASPMNADLAVPATPPNKSLIESHARLRKRLESVVASICALEDGGPLARHFLGDLDDMVSDLAAAKRVGQ
jgi:hypothetical protein